MKLIFIIGLSCFCFNQVILTPTNKIESENDREDIFNSNELCNLMDSKTQFMDLNYDCQLVALKQLKFISLLSFAETNNYFKSLVSVILNQMFREKMVVIAISETYTWSNDIQTAGDNIEIKNFTIAEKVLKNFGHLIQKLKIKLTFLKSYRSIYKLVNLHCSKTLKEITLEKSVNNLLEEFTNQFENVEEVFVDSIFQTERSLNEIFPSVRRLHFSTYEISNTNSINVKYMNLEHLNIYINKYVGALTNNLAAELITKNSHIQSLALEYASAELIKSAADSLPQLEKLKLDRIQNKYNNESISFPNVRIFKTEGNSKLVSNYLFSNLKFGNVEELHIDDLAENMFGENGFFASNTKLKNLQMVSKYDTISLNTDAFKQLARANTTLQQISIIRAASIEVETILQLIENNKQLEKLQIKFFTINGRESTLKTLIRKLFDEWSIETFSDAIILEKTHF